MKLIAAVIGLALLSGIANAGHFEFKPAVGIIPCNALDYGGEFAMPPIPTPPPGQISLVPYPAHVQAALALGPIVIVRTRMRYYFPGPVNATMYAGISANTDPGLVWYNAGGNVNHQNFPEDPNAADLGALLWYYGVDTVRDHHFEHYPAVINPGDGLVVSMVCPFGSGGGLQPVIDFDFVPLSALVGPPS